MNTVLVMNSLATRWMLRRIWRPSATIPGTTPKSSRTSTRSATERDICVPEPWAIAEARLLERGHVVDAVADHRHVAAGVGERVDDRPLALGRDPPDRGRRQDGVAQRRWLGRAAPRRPAPAPSPGTPASRAIAPTVAGASPESTFSSTLLGGEEGDGLGRVGAKALGEHDQAERLDVVGKRGL